MSTTTIDNTQSPFSLFRFIPAKYAGILLAILGCIIYINTLGNKYALDDEIIVNNNHYVLQGISGIPSILTTDMFDSYFKDYQTDQPLSGGRYRPLSMVTFAIEYSLFGATPAISHLINALLYGLLILLIYQVLIKTLRLNADIALLATLLFAIHPIHTEVVANIKSRDEILSLTFIMLTLKYAFEFVDTANTRRLLFGAIAMFLAFLSKEYAYILIPLLPIAVYIFRPQYSKKNLIIGTIALLAISIGYTYMRYFIVGLNIVEQHDLLNNPFLLATHSEALATKIFILLKYLSLLFFPYQLSADYSYKTIPYYNFGNPLVWLSIAVYVGLIAIGLYGIYKKKIIGFATTWYLACMLPVSNLLVDIGATMGERLVFHASLGFCVVLAVIIVELAKKFSINYKVVTAVVACITLLAAGRTLARNPNWYNTYSLFYHDVKIVPNSIMANANASGYCVETSNDIKDTAKKIALLKEGRTYALQSLKYYPELTNALINYGLAEYQLGNIDNSLVQFLKAKKYLPQSPYFKRIANYFYNKGMAVGKSNVPEAAYNLGVACKLDSVNVPAWVNLGGAYFTMQKFDSAKYCWQIALAQDPQNAEARQGYTVIQQMGK